jgi:hypothetical protein
MAQSRVDALSKKLKITTIAVNTRNHHNTVRVAAPLLGSVYKFLPHTYDKGVACRRS